MHWLDTPSREIDPVLDCLTYLAREADRPSSPVLLRAGLALSEDGTLPFHQIEPALDQVGMRGEPTWRRLKGWPTRRLPAILEMADNRAAVMLDIRDGDILHVAETNMIVVSVLPTDVLVVAPRSIHEMGVVAHSLGNRHLQAQFFDASSEYDAEVMVCAYDHTVEDYLLHVGVPYSRQERIMPVPFRHAEHSH